ncbi:2-methoxy-6-polyprenyl-1,4-benzoquinol methylase, mitochondrial [Sporomusa silvacetica DSM 10669]|uniref:2-methoxy-6-polyprenyl-1,4-benzoquinol methylase, mitochondrial n=1 Tax=Sporomusa silvacetica DSM 10669 TaxID=1123289 RepID=A0ABZ3IKV9_9FIRM
MREKNQHLTIYDQGMLKEISGETLRPGGFELTREAMMFCRFSGGANILDVGCGSGATVRFLIENYGLNVLGIDSSQVMINKGKEAYPGLPLMQGRGEDLPVPDGQMDGVLMECSFSLMEDADLVLSEGYRVLKDTGRLIISDVYFKNKTVTMKNALPGHSCLMGADSKQSMIAKLIEHDFELEVWQDKSECINQLVVDCIMKFGSMDKLWNCIFPISEKQNVNKEQVMKWKPGYFLLIACKRAPKPSST